MSQSQQWFESRAAYLDKNQTHHEKWLARKMKKWCEKKDLLCHPQIAMHGYILDFYFPQIDLAIELDGKQHDSQKDAQRDARLLKKGIQVVRFPNPKNNSELNQVLYRIYAEAGYHIKRAKQFKPGAFSTNPQPSQRSSIISNSSNKEILVLDEQSGKVERIGNQFPMRTCPVCHSTGWDLRDERIARPCNCSEKPHKPSCKCRRCGKR